MSRRQRVLKGARIVWGNFLFVQDCLVRDVSDHGARLRVEAMTPVPDNFHLFLNEARSIRPCKVIWRQGTDMGIAYDGESKSVLDNHDARLKRFGYL